MAELASKAECLRKNLRLIVQWWMRRRHSMQYWWKSSLYCISSVTSTMPIVKCSLLTQIRFGTVCMAISYRSTWIGEGSLQCHRRIHAYRHPNKDRTSRPRLCGVPFLSWWALYRGGTAWGGQTRVFRTTCLCSHDSVTEDFFCAVSTYLWCRSFTNTWHK